MQYRVMTRAENIGGGWRWFKRHIEAEAPANACLTVFGDRIKLGGFNEHRDGTPSKPFVIHGGGSEIAAEPDVEGE